MIHLISSAQNALFQPFPPTDPSLDPQILSVLQSHTQIPLPPGRCPGFSFRGFIFPSIKHTWQLVLEHEHFLQHIVCGCEPNPYWFIDDPGT